MLRVLLDQAKDLIHQYDNNLYYILSEAVKIIVSNGLISNRDLEKVYYLMKILSLFGTIMNIRNVHMLNDATLLTNITTIFKVSYYKFWPIVKDLDEKAKQVISNTDNNRNSKTGDLAKLERSEHSDQDQFEEEMAFVNRKLTKISIIYLSVVCVGRNTTM